MSIDQSLHALLQISLIATPKADFRTCTPEDELQQVVSGNLEKFDFMPVIGSKGVILGLVKLSGYFSIVAPAGKVCNFMEPLGEKHLIGANASILDFIREAKENPFRFVISQNGIVGLVSLSDLEKFPVRPVLFSLVTALEMKMADTIRQVFPSAENWLCHLGEARRQKLEDEMAKAKSETGIVDPLLYTQFADKRDVIKKALLKGCAERSAFDQTLKKIQDLRDRIAHANEYANTPGKAAEVCSTVESVFEIDHLMTRLRTNATSDLKKITTES
jgi:hypothetical protein